MRQADSQLYVEPPPELLIGFDWLKFNTPPHAGGLHDQPMLLMHRMKIALNVYETVKAYRQAQDINTEAFSKWQSANPKVIRLMEYIWNLQGAFDG